MDNLKMDNSEVLGHLLKIESEAAAMVSDAQAEADRRVAEAEKQNRAAYEERYQNVLKNLEDGEKKLKEQIRLQYREEIDAFRKKVSSVNVDVNAFAALLDKLIAGESC
jgi:F0F1-type ATP synthase membrane subunit b/b'